MDIANIKPQERTVEILHPSTGEKIGVRVSVMSITDPRLKTLKRRIQNEKNKLEQRGKFFKAEDVEANQNELLASAITSWEWYDAEFKGKKPEFSKETVQIVLTELEWFADQIATEISDEKAFF